MNVFILQIFSVVLAAWRADVSSVAEEKIVIAERNGPNSNIELTTLVQKRSLKILLNDPVGVLTILVDASINLIHLVEDFDALSLIVVRRLDDP